MATTAARGYQLTDRDAALVTWIGQWRVVTAAQIARRFEMSLEMTRRRLRALASFGLVEKWQSQWAGSLAVYGATAAGLSVAELPYSPGKPRTALWHHDLAVIDVAVLLEADGATIVSERAMRSADVAASPKGARRRTALPVEDSQWAVRDPGSYGEKPRWHYPDLVVTDSAGLCAYEVELTAKAPNRCRAIMHGYHAWRRYAEVWWLTGSEKVHRSLTQLARGGSAVSPAMRTLLDDQAGAAGEGVRVEVVRLEEWLHGGNEAASAES